MAALDITYARALVRAFYRSMKSERKDVGIFFNTIARTYREKYTEKDPFRNYFFNERLEEATRDLDLRGKRVLDIGAGTGNLYDRLIELEPTVNYFAIDIAGEMLKNSLIPRDRQFVGEFGNTPLPVESFDLIFMLGVTTYMNDDAFGEHLDLIAGSLGLGGRAIITFTNKRSADWASRRMFKMLPRRALPGKFVLTQDFTIFPRSISEVRKAIDKNFKISRVRWLNHTVFPFNNLFKNLSAKAARKYHATDSDASSSLREALSSDFLVVLERGEGPTAG